jgi:hypothetical protein
MMIIRTVAALLALAVLSAGQATIAKPAAQPEKTTSGTNRLAKALASIVPSGLWWNMLSDDEKDSFVVAYIEAMEQARVHTGAFCDESKKTLQPGPAFDAQMKASMTLCFLTEEFNYKVSVPFKPRLDEFYKEPLNLSLLCVLAMKYVRDEIAGKKTAGQLLDELNDWRKVANRDSSKSAK